MIFFNTPMTKRVTDACRVGADEVFLEFSKLIRLELDITQSAKT